MHCRCVRVPGERRATGGVSVCHGGCHDEQGEKRKLMRPPPHTGRSQKSVRYRDCGRKGQSSRLMSGVRPWSQKGREHQVWALQCGNERGWCGSSQFRLQVAAGAADGSLCAPGVSPLLVNSYSPFEFCHPLLVLLYHTPCSNFPAFSLGVLGEPENPVALLQLQVLEQVLLLM